MKADRKNILHLIETCEVGGAERVMINLACGLEKTDFHSIACLRKEGRLYDELVQRGVETYILKEEGCFDIGFLMMLLSMVIRKKISLIHAHEFLMNAYGTILGVLSGRPVVTTLHGKFYYGEKWRRRAALRFASRVGRLVCVSEDLRHFVSTNLKIPHDRIRIIYNGVDTKIHEKNPNYSSIRAELGMSDHYKVVGTVANLSVVKGHTYLLKAIPTIIRECPNVVFLFAGRGDEDQKLRNEALKLGISEYVRFLGFRSDVPELLQLVDVFVLPSLSECLPLSVLEAMALSVPAVVTDVGGIREIIEDQRTGYIVPAADPSALAEKVLLLLKDEDAARSMSLKAREVIIEKFSIDVMLDQYQSLYNSLIG